MTHFVLSVGAGGVGAKFVSRRPPVQPVDPLMTFKAMAGIHWEALKMLLKGIRYLGRQPASTSAIAPVSAAMSSSEATNAGVK